MLDEYEETLIVFVGIENNCDSSMYFGGSDFEQGAFGKRKNTIGFSKLAHPFNLLHNGYDLNDKDKSIDITSENISNLYDPLLGYHFTQHQLPLQSRSKEFNIKGVTYSLTQGVVKNIIPAIASTNAVIAAYSYDPAACCNEAFKLVTTSQPYLNNYMMYTGNEGVYTYTFEHQKKPNCPVCGNQSVTIEVNRDYL
ncbi:4984_t:CDS:2, partial [Entrophospora sp. SA101]